MHVLTGHTSPETGYRVDDYPYGYTLRTTIRYWVETKKNFGQRMVSQTVNPKNGRLNKPKAGTYCAIQLLALDEQDHVVPIGIHGGAGRDQIDAFIDRAGDSLDEYQQEALKWLEAADRAGKRLTTEMHICQPGCTEEHQTIEEQQKLYRRVTAQEYAHGKTE